MDADAHADADDAKAKETTIKRQQFVDRQVYERFSLFGSWCQSRKRRRLAHTMALAKPPISTLTCMSSSAHGDGWIKSVAHQKQAKDTLQPLKQQLPVAEAVAAAADQSLQAQPRHHQPQQPSSCLESHSTHLLMDRAVDQLAQDPTFRRQMHDEASHLWNCLRRKTSLSSDQHAQYVELQRNRREAQQNGLPAILALNAQENEQWTQLKQLVRAEQSQFYLEFARLAQLDDRSDLYAHAPAFAEQFFAMRRQQCQQQVYRLYPRYYELAAEFRLQELQFATPDAVWKHSTAAFTEGSCFQIAPQALAVDQENVDIIEQDLTSPSFGHFVGEEPISADARAEQLMAQHDCDVAVSGSTLETLFNNDHDSMSFEQPFGWLIPMKIRSQTNKKTNTKCKRVFLDEPQVLSSESSREMLSKVLEAALYVKMHKLSQEKPSEEEDSPCVLSSKVLNETATLGGQQSYHVWRMQDKRILVRCRTRAAMPAVSAPVKTASSNSSNNQPHGQPTRLASVVAKVDFRPLAMREQLSSPEKSRCWLHAWLRGDCAILIGKVDLKHSMALEWEQHSLRSIVYSSDTSSMELFEPFEKLRVVNAVLLNACELPGGNYVLHYEAGTQVIKVYHACDSSTIPSPSMTSSAASKTMASTTHASSDRFDLYEFISKSRDDFAREEMTFHRVKVKSTTLLRQMDFVLPQWQPSTRVPLQVPFTFRLPTFCIEFFEQGFCSRLAANAPCIAMHLRQRKVSANGVAGKPASTLNTTWSNGGADKNALVVWQFEDFSELLKKTSSSTADATGHDVGSGKEILRKAVPMVKPHFPFCYAFAATNVCRRRANATTNLQADDSQEQETKSSADSSEANVMNRLRACTLPHLTLFQVVQRVVEDESRRSKQKKKSIQQHQKKQRKRK